MLHQNKPGIFLILFTLLLIYFSGYLEYHFHRLSLSLRDSSYLLQCKCPLKFPRPCKCFIYITIFNEDLNIYLIVTIIFLIEFIVLKISNILLLLDILFYIFTSDIFASLLFLFPFNITSQKLKKKVNVHKFFLILKLHYYIFWKM